MAVIDPKKLLPSSNKSENSEKFLVPMSSIVLKKNVAISSRLLKPEAPKDEGKGGAIVPNKLVDKIVKVESILKSNLVSQISQQNKKEREQKQKEAEEREKKLEIKPESKGKVPLPSLPRIGFLDALRNYFINTLLGFIAVKLFDMAPKLIKFLDAIKPVAGFIGEFAGNLFNGLVEFVDKGYKAYDQVQKFVKSVGGENAEKTFKEFSSKLNLLLNGAIIAATIAISTAPKRPGGVSGGTGGGVAGGVKAGANILERGSLSRVNESFGRYISGKANIGDRARLLRRGFIGGRQALTKGGTEALEKGAARTAARTAASQGAKELAKQGAKQSLKSLVAVPIIGSLIGFIIDTVVFREPPSRAAAGAVGSALGQGIGIALAGGTTFGLGAGIGMFVGGFVGDWIGKALYDTITSFSQEPVQAKAQGGVVSSGRGKTPPRRGIKVQKAKPKKIITQRTQPGKDIGGVKKIEELYGEDKPGTRSALRALKKSSEDVKRMRSLNGLSGAMFGAGIDMALGQKPDKNLSASLGSMFGAVIQTAIDSELNNTFGDITKTIAMAGGGVVPSRELKSNMSIGERIGRYISSALAVSIESSAAKILQNLNKELRLEGGPAGETPGGGDGGGGGEIPPELLSAGLTENMAGYLTRLSYLETRIRNIPNASGSEGRGYYQAFNAFEKEAISASGGLSARDANFTTATKAVMSWIRVYNPTAFAAIQSGEFDKADRLLKGTWPSLPGGSQAQPDNIQIESRRYLPSKGGSIPYVKPDKNIKLTLMRRRSRTHAGSDIAANEGTPLRAISDGTIVDADKNPGGWGNFLIFKDDKGIYHLYGHLQNEYKKSGTVKKGDIIAKVGMTGRTTGPHLHWEAGTGWNKYQLTGAFDPLDKYSINAPFFTEKVSTPPPTAKKPPTPTPKPALQNKGVVYDPSTGKFVQKGGGLLGTDQEIKVTDKENTTLRESVKGFGLGTGKKEGEVKQAKDGSYYVWRNGKWENLYAGGNALAPKQTQSSTVASVINTSKEVGMDSSSSVLAYYYQERHYIYDRVG